MELEAFVRMRPVSQQELEGRPLKPACTLNGFNGKAFYLDETLPKVIIKTETGYYELDMMEISKSLEKEKLNKGGCHG